MLTDEEIKTLGDKADDQADTYLGVPGEYHQNWHERRDEFFARAIEAEVIERAAAICDGMALARAMFIKTDGTHGTPYVPSDCAAAIRAMGEKK